MVNTETHRCKYKNIARDLIVTLILKEENSYHYAEMLGEAMERVMGQEARGHIDKFSRKYHDEDCLPDAS